MTASRSFVPAGWGLAVIVVTALSTGGCSPLLFSDTFEADTVGAPPAAYPPGNPAGDSVQIPADTSAEPAIVEVVNHPHLRGKALAYRHSGRSPFP